MIVALTQHSETISFDNDLFLTNLYGEQDKHLKLIEKKLDVSISARANIVYISGDKKNSNIAKKVLEKLYSRIENGEELVIDNVYSTIKKISNINEVGNNEITICTPKKVITPYTNSQKEYLKALLSKDMVFAKGVAGTGKTYLAVSVAVSMLMDHKVERIILCRPAVEAGEKIGFLPGDMKEKVDPYMQPLYDSLYDMLTVEKVNKLIENKIVEIAPLAFMRGRTLKNAFVILDEAQNTTIMQMKMFLTRMGEGSHFIINGDLSQIDLPHNVTSGFLDAIERLQSLDDIAFVNFLSKDIIRNSLVSKIVDLYDKE